MKNRFLYHLNISFIFLLTFTDLQSAFAQPIQNRYSNPVLSMRDGATERLMGYYYAIGEATNGNIYYSKDMVNWSGPVLAVTTNEATWLNDPKWTQAYVYKEMQAGDLIYRNGVFHAYWNGIGHAYSATPLGRYKEGSVNEPFDDYGIDVQVFQDEDGETYWVKKRNPSDPHPLTGAPSNIDGPETWAFKMNSVFSRKDITVGGVQLTHQRGHPTSLNHVNFEGPELFKHRGRYYQFFASNRMGPRSGMYQIGVAESNQPMNFNNAKKYPHPVLARNTEQHMLNYKTILHSAEHGGWDSRYITGTPATDWKNVNFNDNAWTLAQGGFGRQEYDLFGGTTYTNAKLRPRKTVWNTSKIYVRRKFSLTEVPSKIALKHWVYADADFYINGNKVSVKSRNNTYEYLQLNPAFFVTGENVIAVEATSPCSDQYCQQFIDFGLYDTGDTDAEDIVIGPAQPNFVVGPNGFERWMMYKAYFSNKQVQGIDRIHFYNKEVVVESSTVKNTKGYRPKPALPTMINYCDYPIYYPFAFLNESLWKISSGILSPENATGGDLLFRRDAETNYRFEVPFRLQQSDGWAGAYAYYKDHNNWLRIQIGRNKTWKTELCVNGLTEVTIKDLPAKFAFLDNNPLVSHYEEPWHTLTIYKNTGRFRVELDYFNLTLGGDIETGFEGAGLTGLTASSNNVSFDAVQYTTGWDEYDNFISGWKNNSGTWTVNTTGLIQTDVTGRAETFKGDSAWNYEFSTYVKNNQLPSSGEAGFYPLYIDDQNYVRASINYTTKTLDIEGKDNGNVIENQSFSLKKQVLRQYTVSTYPTTSYRYDLRNESEISGVNILWLEGNYPYLNQTFDLPKTVNFYALQNGAWVLLNTQLEGELRLSYMNHFTFPSVKTTAIRMDVTNNTGKASRAFSAYFDEELSAGYYLRCRREEDGLHIFVDETYQAKVTGNWGKSVVGLVTEDLPAIYN
ncbi:MAG: family 43 glycosylhydrolase, partial [Paludibacter sp.]|nr:family 43 glycosylhydrolase [Paludibacter sp.]